MDPFNIYKSLSSANELKVSDYGLLNINITQYSSGLKGSFMYEVKGKLLRGDQLISFNFALHKDCTIGQFFDSLDAYISANPTSNSTS